MFFSSATVVPRSAEIVVVPGSYLGRHDDGETGVEYV
jgi:hypothetical protein